MASGQAVSHVPSSIGLTCVAKDPRIPGTLSLKILPCSSRMARERRLWYGERYYFYDYDTGCPWKELHA
eukprot:4340597-Karenia_brevis.AAC.1